MRRYLLAMCLGLAILPAARAGILPDRSERIVDYRIQVRLFPETKQLKASQRLTWRNPSNDAVPDLWFHLYLNAFKNNRSTFFRESGGQLRGDRMSQDRWGWIDVKSMRIAGGADLTNSLKYEHPDDDNGDDQTVGRVVLPTAVPPGGSITLEIEFEAQLPQVFARTGYFRDYYLIGQWFPKVGVYEPAGRRGRVTGGWNCHQFHATSEFYADYGTYEVEMTVPSSFVLGATGVRTSRRENSDGTVTYTHQQADVHDFAWTAWPRFLEIRDKFSADRDVTPAEYEQTVRWLGRSPEDVRLSDVEIILLLDPRHQPQTQRYLNAAKAGIKYFGLWYGRYPYPTLTVVDPAFGAAGSGGMEYPTLITGGTSWLLNYWPLSGVRAAEMVTIHEYGHQFWYGLVGNNEFEEAWLDEGITSYSTGKILEIVFGRDTAMVDLPFLKLGEIEMVRLQNNPDQKFNSILRPAWKYTPSGAYGFNSYGRPELVLRTLENHLGEQTMARVMRGYHERWRFRHPSSDDFFAAASDISGQDLKWYFDQTVRSGDIVDYEIASVSTQQVAEPTGVFDREGKRMTITAKEAADKEKQAAKDKGSARFESKVVVRRRGEVVFPVEIALKFENQPTERISWDGRDRTHTLVKVGPNRLEWAAVDPDGQVPLDVDWLNNSRRITGDGRAAGLWASRWMFWIQQLLVVIGL